MSQRIIECVPNFSEGRDKAVIRQITAAIEASGGVKLLDVDPGEATNRTVVTFVGEPEAVVEAAFAGVKRAAELIDMRRHKGAHPRMGATDVLPLIPIAGVTLAECAELARALARRIADELRIPTYCYEAAAFAPERKNLAVCRAGEYEALPEKLAHTASAPDFGARPFDEGVARTGATTVGARDFLIAVNFNLNTTSTRRANAIAFDVREKGRPVREGNPNSVSDAGVGALAARSAVLGACLNVKINAAGLKDRAVADALIAEADALAAEAVRLEAEVLQIVESKIG